MRDEDKMRTGKWNALVWGVRVAVA